MKTPIDKIVEKHAYIDFTPHANQQKVMNSKALFKAIEAGKRFGKSKMEAYESVRMAGQKNRCVVWYVAPTYGQAKEIVWDELMTLIPYELIHRASESTLTLELADCHSEIKLKSADNPQTLRGPGITGGLICDEFAYFPEFVWGRILKGQLKEGVPGHFISSPYNPLSADIKIKDHFSAFCDQAKQRMESGDESWGYWHFTIYDNPTLSRKFIEEVRMENTDEDWNLEYLAKRSVFAGLVYHEFNSAKNIAEYDGIKELPVGRAHDYGRTHPHVTLWFKVDIENKTIYVTDEYVKSGNIIRDNAAEILKMSGDMRIEWDVIDPSARKHDQIAEQSIIEEFYDNNIVCEPGDNTERGYDITKMFLKYGMLKISPRCINLISELRNLKYGQKVKNDATDSLRYGCVFIYDMYPDFRNYVEVQSKVERKFTPEQIQAERVRSVYNLKNLMERAESTEFSVPDYISSWVA